MVDLPPIPPEAIAELEALRRYMAERGLRGRLVLALDQAPDKRLEWQVWIEKAIPPPNSRLDTDA